MDSNNQSLPSVEIVKILPAFSAEEVFAQKKCYLGISLANPVFEKNNLKALLLWASANFKQCLVVIGDGPVEISYIVVCEPAIVVGFSGVGINLDDSIEITYCSFQVTALAV